MGRNPGDWYGPQAMSIVLKKLNKKFQPYQDFEIVVCNEGNVYLDKIEKHIFNKNSPKSVYVTIPVRLGLASIA